MSTTKKQIEAELNASEREKAVANVLESLAAWMEFDDWLYAEEQEVWQPHWSRDDKLVDRLARIGTPPKLVKEFGRRLAHMGDPILGKPLPSDLQKEIDDAQAAEKSALEQLDKLVAGRRRK